MPTIVKSDFVVHGEENSAIYSLHASPDGRRLATAGQDCKIRIWDMECIQNEDNDSPNKLLSTISHHSGAVNCVRWSPCGKYLATCSDDCLVLVLNLSSATLNYVPLGEKEANKETWEIFRSWRSHSKDVMHVDWSPEGTRLASCGLDNKVVVWLLSAHNGQPLELRGHNGMVKGLAWDPVGKYLATQGDGGEEKSVVVWRVRDWQMEAKTTKPFRNAPDETMFLRLSWSPDGQHLAGTNAFKGNKNTCALLERATATNTDPEWATATHFVGCQEPVVVASFHPKLLKRPGKGFDACCALGGSDCTLTIWSASHSGRPIFIVNDLFEKQIIDITWGGGGTPWPPAPWTARWPSSPSKSPRSAHSQRPKKPTRSSVTATGTSSQRLGGAPLGTRTSPRTPSSSGSRRASSSSSRPPPTPTARRAPQRSRAPCRRRARPRGGSGGSSPQ